MILGGVPPRGPIYYYAARVATYESCRVGTRGFVAIQLKKQQR